MRKILTPSSIYKYRIDLNSNLQRINGQLMVQQRPLAAVTKNNALVDLSDREFIRKSLHPKVPKLLRTWKHRARRLVLLRSQLAGLLEQMTEPNCAYCGIDWGLKCESIGSIEELFQVFMRERNIKWNQPWNAREWQEFFIANSIVRTICYECHESLLPKVDPAQCSKAHKTLQVDTWMSNLSMTSIPKLFDTQNNPKY